MESIDSIPSVLRVLWNIKRSKYPRLLKEVGDIVILFLINNKIVLPYQFHDNIFKIVCQYHKSLFSRWRFCVF
jgi:hypothetical protein